MFVFKKKKFLHLFPFFQIIFLHVNLYVEHYSTTFQIGYIYLYF